MSFFLILFQSGLRCIAWDLGMLSYFKMGFYSPLQSLQAWRIPPGGFHAQRADSTRGPES